MMRSFRAAGKQQCGLFVLGADNLRLNPIGVSLRNGFRWGAKDAVDIRRSFKNRGRGADCKSRVDCSPPRAVWRHPVLIPGVASRGLGFYARFRLNYRGFVSSFHVALPTGAAVSGFVPPAQIRATHPAGALTGQAYDLARGSARRPCSIALGQTHRLPCLSGRRNRWSPRPCLR